jgi:hypothetical protein
MVVAFMGGCELYEILYYGLVAQEFKVLEDCLLWTVGLTTK